MSTSAVVHFLYQNAPEGTPLSKPLTKKYYCACHVIFQGAQLYHAFVCG
jgi:hypothetical protein